MKETLKVLNGMLKAEVVQRYAIGGAVAAIYYLEPMDTLDLDIFVQLEVSGSDLSILAPIYEYLSARGYQARGEFVEIEGMPVQFLPVFNPLTEEAVACGAFGNDSNEISKLFRRALENNFCESFEYVVFAITDWSEDERFIGPFVRAFGNGRIQVP